jgi:hypothetical protein
MAMTYAEQTTFKTDAAWQDAVCQAALEYAATVRAESEATPNHVLRADFAARVTAEPDYWKGPITANVATDAALDTTPTDAELLTAVTAAWDRLSAVPGEA